MNSNQEVTKLSDIAPFKKFTGFGIVLDTTRSIRINNPKITEYSTQLKVMDMSMNPIVGASGGQTKQYLTFFIYWSSQEHQPFTYRIGDIIRFVNFDFEKYKDFLQGKNKSTATWCIFAGDSSNNEPYCQSSKYNEKMTQFHVQRLSEIRQWSVSFFQKYSLKELDWYSYDRHLQNMGAVQSFDMMVRVEKISFQQDQFKDLLVTVVDDKLMNFQTYVSAVHGRFLREGTIVKMRSIERIEGSYLKGHSKYFAVLEIPHFFRDYQEFVEIIDLQENEDTKRIGTREEKQVDDTLVKLYANFNSELYEKGGFMLQGGSVLSSGVTLKKKNLLKKTVLEVLRDLDTLSYQRILNEGRKYHLRATLIDIKPKSLAQCLRNQCQTCQVLRRLDAVEGDICCSRKMEKTVLLRLLWQDQSVMSSNKLLISYVVPSRNDLTKCIFPDFKLEEVQVESKVWESKWEETMEKYLEDDRLFDILLEPFENFPLNERDGQVPLRLSDTLFVPLMKGEKLIA